MRPTRTSCTPVEVEDFNARANVVKLLLEQGFGRAEYNGRADVAGEWVEKAKRVRAMAERARELLRRDPVEYRNRHTAQVLWSVEALAVAALGPGCTRAGEQAIRQEVREDFVRLLKLDPATTHAVVTQIDPRKAPTLW
jgi:hypothetical protein